ncbi:hypothetical protein [Okeania sp. SIO2B3]|uniref:hypothetical protein n=1 Tax=Okeania sp. SIO2B3 TaxID=2607784 RepID=UPI0013C131E9|nr:hypothetical protein [Okeania sp. SIO2B3]NET45445.1 hypothetical protein [Okeania sp. SIO2B3]
MLFNYLFSQFAEDWFQGDNSPDNPDKDDFGNDPPNSTSNFTESTLKDEYFGGDRHGDKYGYNLPDATESFSDLPSNEIFFRGDDPDGNGHEPPDNIQEFSESNINDLDLDESITDDSWEDDNDEKFFQRNSSDDTNADNSIASSDSLESDRADYYIPENNWCPEDFDGWGDPIQDGNCWEQQDSGTSCAVVAQIAVYESITGMEISETKACEIAQTNGWYDPQKGTTGEDIGKLLEGFGISTKQSYDATLVDIAEALEKGDKVIVGLDANEIWYPYRDSTTGNPIEQTNVGHAVWVTGIDPQPDGSIKIILNDSATPDGKMKAIDAEDFLNAWEDFSNLLVVADTPNKRLW